MKKQIIFSAIFKTAVHFILLTVLATSCNRKDESSQTNSVYTDLVIFDKTVKARNISFYEIPQKVNNASRQPTNESILCRYAELLGDGTSEIVRILKNEYQGAVTNMPTNPYTLFIYSQEGGILTNIADVYGIGYIELANGKMNHHFIKISNLVGEEVSKFSVTTDYITHAELDYLAAAYKKPTSGYGYSMYKNLSVTTGALRMNQPNNSLARAVVYDIGHTELIPFEDSKGCNSKPTYCSNRKTSYCQYDVGWYCSADGCRFAQVSSQGSANGLIDPSKPLTDTKAYEIRDSLMNKYVISRKYIDYYYTLSYYGNAFKQTLSASNLVEHISLAYKMIEACDKLKSGSNNDIIITNDIKNISLSLIAQYKQFSNNSYITAILDDIANDMNHFANKTKQAVLNEIQ